MTDRDLIKLLKKDGWKLDRINGSHHIFRKDGTTVSVPVHGKDVPTGLLHQILKDTGLK
ncbi:MAG: type II toxin-antitoxin system HicA family toxin [Lachnospiraceae bacterium]|nr:type II toxin-antitoxin system HicA family toxin [Lachnospiraceae bacterium]MCI9151262.1 type II toxin-antitoxin system HicA family toxin [Lachnospiraceae bacterium]